MRKTRETSLGLLFELDPEIECTLCKLMKEKKNPPLIKTWPTNGMHKKPCETSTPLTDVIHQASRGRLFELIILKFKLAIIQIIQAHVQFSGLSHADSNTHNQLSVYL